MLRLAFRAARPALRRRRLNATAVALPQSAPPLKSPLRGGATLEALRLAARCARLADFAYWDCNLPPLPASRPPPPPETAPLAALLAADGCRLVAAGRTGCTSWYVADEAAARTRHVVLRGVAWRDARMDTTVLSQRLASAWRTQLSPGGPLHAHAGVASMAEELWPQLEPYVEGARAPSPDSSWRLALSGHSLGGALAVLMAALCRLRAAFPPQQLAPVHAFGSPPVLAEEGEEATRLLGLPRDGIRGFVLDTDPVPSLWSGSGVGAVGEGGGLVGALASAGSGLAGVAARLMGTKFGHAGQVYFMSWEGGQSAVMELLATPSPPPRARGLAGGEGRDFSIIGLWRGALDHNRRSYTDALALLQTLAEGAQGKAAAAVQPEQI